MLVRTPAAARLSDLLRARGLEPEADVDEPTRLRVPGTSTDDVGRLAAQHGLTLLELSAVRASLEQAYLELTAGAAQYTGTRSQARTSRDAQAAA